MPGDIRFYVHTPKKLKDLVEKQINGAYPDAEIKEVNIDSIKREGMVIGNEYNIFSRDGIYLGWLENELVWDSRGNFRGQVNILNGNRYILKNSFSIPPIPRIPKIPPISPIPPVPPINISPIMLPIGYEDAF